MDIIPLIYIQDGEILGERGGTPLTFTDVFNQVEKDALLYIVDLDGIENGRMKLDLYQRISDHCTVWMDAGPRRLVDVMDIVISGATNITIRRPLWPDPDIRSVREIIEDEIYLLLDESQKESFHSPPIFSEIDGLVVFSSKGEIGDDFTFGSYLNDVAGKRKLYLYTVSPSAVTYWSERGVTGVLVDLHKKERYSHGK